MRWANENQFDAEIYAAAVRHGVPAALLKAVVARESAFNPNAIREEPQIADRSRGLGQVLERTARALGFNPKDYPNGYDALFWPSVNLDLAAMLLADNYARSGYDWDVAVSAYNAGWSTVRPGDAKRTATGALVNASYVDKVKREWEYFKPLMWAGAGVLVVALMAWYLLAHNTTRAMGA